MNCHVLPATRRRAWTFAFAASALVSSSLFAQSPDSSRASHPDSARTLKLERVMISAVRGSGAAAISQKTLSDSELKPRYVGQDVPLLLQGAARSPTWYA